MRKHHTRWVALCSVVAISTSGLVGLAGPAVADDENTRAFAWPVVSQGVSSYSLDGYELTYLPPGLDRYGINATSTTDRQGNSRSQLSWIQGPEQLYGRVTVLRAESLQEIDDLRSSRYSHLSEGSLEQLPESETFEYGAYLAEESGDLFWIDSPGVAVSTHLQPDRWKSTELVRMAEAVAEVTEAEAAPEAAPAEEAEVTEPEGSAAEVPEAEPQESPNETVTEDEGTDETPAENEPAEEEIPAEDEGADETPVGQTPEEGTPEDETPAEETPAEEDVAEEDVAEEDVAEEDVAEEIPVEESPDEESPDEAADPTQEEAPQVPEDETPGEEPPTGAEATDEEAPQEDPVAEVGDNDGAEEESTDPVEADLSDQAPSHEVKACVTEHFVDFDSASSDLDQELMTPTSQKFVEKALNKNDLSDDERDRLLATVWYYGHEGDKVTAIDDCAEHFDLRRGEVEDVINEVSDIIAELAQEAQAEETDPVEGDGSYAQLSEEDASIDITDPIGSDEWEELWDSLPWSIPAEQR